MITAVVGDLVVLPVGTAHKRMDSGDGFAVVGAYPDGASWVGAVDMAGNVWEWVEDYYDAREYDNSGSNDPKGASIGFYRVIRGGGWYSGPGQVTVTNRQWFSPGYAEASVGFRCVRK